MTSLKPSRIESIDVLRGVVMVIMALDHVRDYFHIGSFYNDPTNLDTTTPILFFTRFITNYCAPVFVFLAGTSAFLYGSRKPKPELFRFLFTRGLWLIFLEVVVNNLNWTFDLTYSLQIFQVIWAIGFSMVCLSLLIYLPQQVMLIVGLVLVAGHHLLDGITMQGQDLKSVVWYLLHQDHAMVLGPNKMVLLHYPVIPWIGLMTLGYLFGTFYRKDFDPSVRRKWLLRLGAGSVLLFFALRGLNFYGDLVPWSIQETTTQTVLSFFKVTKYPPSLLFLCMTIGPALLFLYVYENTKNKLTDFFLVFGRVPLFYYFLHVFVIHTLAIAVMMVTGGHWQDMFITASGFMQQKLVTHGYSLPVVYLVWVLVVLALYPFCKKYMHYKAANKDKWWLSYL